MSDINEVRSRLNRALDLGRAPGMAADIDALLADHARLTEELRKVNAGETVSVRFDLSPAAKWSAGCNDRPTLCALCRVREEVCRDAGGVPFCQMCWDGGQAGEAKEVQP